MTALALTDITFNSDLESSVINDIFAELENWLNGVTASADISITGDLTVDTDTLFVDASTDTVIVGTTSRRTDFYTGSLTAAMQVEGTSFNSSSLSLTANGSNAYPLLYMGRSRGSSGGVTIVQDGDIVAAIVAQGADGTTMMRAVEIEFKVDGTPAANDMPGEMIIKTNNGSTNTVEAMRIKSNQRISMGGVDTPLGLLHIDQASSSGAIPVLFLDQGDIDQPLISFNGNVAASNTSTISSLTTSGATTHHLQCDLNNGTKLWIAASTNNPT